MDHEQPSPMNGDDVHFAYPSSAEIERLMARGRALRAEALADVARAAVAALRRAFGHAATPANHTAHDLRPHAR